MPAEDRTLDWWVGQLVGALDAEPASAVRLRQVAGRRRARVCLDEEAVVASFDRQGRLVIEAGEIQAGAVPAGEVAASDGLDGEGATTRADVRAILAGRLDASQAVLSGRIVVRGPTEAVGAMLHAIEIFLDAAGRLPALRRLSDALTAQAPAPEIVERDQPTELPGRELDVLSALDLLP